MRGLDYYTRTAFEFVDEAIGAKSSICGGGRYDGLIEQLGGKPDAGDRLAPASSACCLAGGGRRDRGAG